MGPDELSDYCRQVEDHLTRVNGGHLVRIVGAGFDIVRQWAESGIPLTVVFRGIDLKAERHRLGASRRPLRIEFCEDDVRELFEGWRRAVGLSRESEPAERPSLGKQLDRVIERIGRVAARVDLPTPFLDALGRVLEEAVAIRERAKGARGSAREALTAQVAALDSQLTIATRAAAPPSLVEALAQDAARDLAPFRQRLDAKDWQQAVDVTVDRLLRDHYGLPSPQ